MSRVVRYLMTVARGLPSARALLLGSALFGVVAGLGTTGLLAGIERAISAAEARSRAALLYASLVVLVAVSAWAARWCQIRLSTALGERLRGRLCRALLSAPLSKLEKLGSAPSLAALNLDIPSLVSALVAVPQLALHGALLIGSLGYLAWLSRWAFAFTVAALAPVVVVFRIVSARARREQQAARVAEEGFYGRLRDLVEGQKELKLDARKGNEYLLRLLHPAGLAAAAHQVAGQTLYSGAGSFGQGMFFALIGLVLFVAPRFVGIDAPAMTGYALTIIYLLIPTDGILNTLPILGQARASLDRLEALGLALDREADAAPSLARPGASDRIALVGAESHYRDAGQDAFRLGPLDFDLSRPEVVFLVGGNGSGKTTLAKLLTGLYPLDAGAILVDGSQVEDPCSDAYRNRFSAVFADFHLFAELLGIEKTDLDERASALLRALRLEHKVAVREGRLTTLDLSQGERKRLALLMAYLEDRSIYVFDEWAADQDPEFKRVFYRELLPELRTRGKVAVVISHDERFFDVADRVVKLDRGRVETAPVAG